jgi:SAM-dependent methyltransferase
MSEEKWEKIYSNGEQLNAWPFTDLVSLFMRNKYNLVNSRKHEGPFRVLELGFGAGNNIEFFLSQGIEYHGIEYSKSAFEWAQHRFSKLDPLNLKFGSFVNKELYDGKFDAIIDRGSVTCCTNLEVIQTMANVRDSLHAGGLFFGIDWFSKNHSDFSLPSTFVDSFTRKDFSEGQFRNTGLTHFVNHEEILNIFMDFQILSLTEKIIKSEEPKTNSHQFASWSIVAQKQ